MSLRKRLDRLEAKRGPRPPAGPSVIFLCDGATGEPLSAMIRGGSTVNREPDEPREAFEARASAGAPAAIHLPSDGIAALATGKTPQWAKSKLVLQVVEERLGRIL